MKLLLSVLAIPCLALGAGGSPDSSFYKSLAQGGLAEVDLGQLASEKATNPSVKDFGTMMVKDHSAANEELNSSRLQRHHVAEWPGRRYAGKEGRVRGAFGRKL